MNLPATRAAAGFEVVKAAVLAAVRAAEERRRSDTIAHLLERAALLERFRRAGADAWAAERAACKGSGPYDAEACLYFLKRWAWIRDEQNSDPLLKRQPYVPWPRQEEFVRWWLGLLSQGLDGLVPKGRKIGFTWTALLVAVWQWIFWGLDTIFGSTKRDKVDRQGDSSSLFEKIRFAVGALPWELQPRWTSKLLVIKNLDSGAELVGESANEGFARGGRAHALVQDEFAELHPNLAESVLKASETVARARLFIYNPNGTDHPSFRMFSTMDPAQIFILDWTADPYRPPEWKASRIVPIGTNTPETFAQEHEADHRARTGIKVWTVTDSLLYRDDELPATYRKALAHYGGWDFGSGASSLVNLLGCVEFPAIGEELPLVWVDAEIVVQRVAWQEAARRSLDLMQRYSSMRIHGADPAGMAKESDQTSWIEKLQSAGVPVVAAPGGNVPQTQDLLRTYAQRLMSAGRLRINQDTCPQLWEAVQQWRWDVPVGVSELDAINRAHVKPEKGKFSHPCETLLYLLRMVELALEQHWQQQRQQAAHKRTQSRRGGPLQDVPGRRGSI